MKAKDCLHWRIVPLACYYIVLGAISLYTCISPIKWNPWAASSSTDKARKLYFAEEEARRKDTPIPLPTQRPRALTAPLPPTPQPSCEPSRSLWRRPSEQRSPKGRWTCPQKLSPFFEKLPPEIRHQIYVCVFQDDAPRVRIVRKIGQRRLGHVRSRCSCIDSSRFYESVCCNAVHKGADWYPYHSRDRTDGGVLSILKSCRKLYAEAIDTLYQSQTFALANLETMILFSVTILPQRLNVVRSLQLTYKLGNCGRWNEVEDLSEWRRVCGILSSMRALEELRVDIKDRIANVFHPLHEDVLRPLTALTAVTEFEVRINWSSADDPSFQGEGVPFRLVELGSLLDMVVCSL